MHHVAQGQQDQLEHEAASTEITGVENKGREVIEEAESSVPTAQRFTEDPRGRKQKKERKKSPGRRTEDM